MLGDDFLDGGAHGLRALQRGSVGQRHGADQIALILGRHEASGNDAEKQRIDPKDGCEREKREHPVIDRELHAAQISVRQPHEGAIERTEQPVLLVLTLENDRAHRRREGERDEAGDDHRGRDRDRELLVELAGESAEESHGNENRHQH